MEHKVVINFGGLNPWGVSWLLDRGYNLIHDVQTGPFSHLGATQWAKAALEEAEFLPERWRALELVIIPPPDLARALALVILIYDHMGQFPKVLIEVEPRSFSFAGEARTASEPTRS